jgi:outer membrane protein assembly factor BamB
MCRTLPSASQRGKARRLELCQAAVLKSTVMHWIRGLLSLAALQVALGCNGAPLVTSSRAELRVTPLALDFGARPAGARSTLAVEVTNTGTAPLTLALVQLEGDGRGAFSLGAAPGALQPGEVVSLLVTYAAPLAEGPDGASLVIESDARNAPELRIAVAGRSVQQAGPTDAGPSDAGPPDAGPHDAGPRDAGVADGGLEDAGAADAGLPDAGRPDAGPRDGGPPPSDGGCAGPYASGSRAVTYQVDVAHTGAQPDDELRLPLCRRWRRDLGGAPGFPVIADGRVFVVTRTSQAGYGTLLWALDQHSGATLWGPVDLGGTFWWAALAWDDGRVFAVNANGFLRAFDAVTGALLWGRQLPGQYSCDSAPTASGGSVFAGASGSGGTLYALDARDGGLRWSQPVTNGGSSSPAVSATGVHVSYACNRAYGFAPSSGALLWRNVTSCSGGGGKNVALFRGRVYTRDSSGNLVLDAATGAEVGRFESRTIPAFSGDLALATPNARLIAMSVTDGGQVWALDAGAESVLTAPLVVGPHVIVATATRLLAVNLADGSLASALPLSGVRGPDEQNVSTPLAGFAAADGMLFVPVGTAVEAY